MTKTQYQEDTFTAWRSSYRQLRVLESELVKQSRSGEDPLVLARMYEQVEARRSQTSELFQLAQTASMEHQVPRARATSMPMETTPSEFAALRDG